MVLGAEYGTQTEHATVFPMDFVPSQAILLGKTNPDLQRYFNDEFSQ